MCETRRDAGELLTLAGHQRPKEQHRYTTQHEQVSTQEVGPFRYPSSSGSPVDSSPTSLADARVYPVPFGRSPTHRPNSADQRSTALVRIGNSHQSLRSDPVRRPGLGRGARTGPGNRCIESSRCLGLLRFSGHDAGRERALWQWQCPRLNHTGRLALHLLEDPRPLLNSLRIAHPSCHLEQRRQLRLPPSCNRSTIQPRARGRATVQTGPRSSHSMLEPQWRAAAPPELAKRAV